MKFVLAILALSCLATSAEASGGLAVRQRFQGRRNQVNRRVVRERFVNNGHAQQFNAGYVQQFNACGAQQFNAGCHQDGVLQFNSGCSALYR